jgi:glycogen debranching enzyme
MPMLRILSAWAYIAASLLLAACYSMPEQPAAPPTAHAVSLDSLAIPVSAEENRAVSFTNKRSAFYYTQTHRNDHPEHAFFRGFNIAGRRIFSDYRLIGAGTTLDPQTATVIVRPDALIRTYPQGITEALRLFDGQDVVEVEVRGAKGDVTLQLSGDTVTHVQSRQGIDEYTATQDGNSNTVDHIAVGRSGNRFLIATGSSREAARALFDEAVAAAPAWQDARSERLTAVVSGDHYFRSDDPRLTEALRWLQLTTDSLVTRQRGDGIYAGLPWFNEYWGRDSFISLPGATLVTGHFEEARAILTSFAGFQDLDRSSRHYGRLPNIVKPGSIDYHTTDGTPRWVIALRDYVRYTGDRTIVEELYPNVQASIEGALVNFTDASGYLVHADNETWMDARREPDKVSYSPRSTRANDIQALWYEQLRAGAEFAAALGDRESAARWSAAADRLRSRFAHDFMDPATGRMADHLDARDFPKPQLRPNALFSLQLLDQPDDAARAARQAWEALVYPWGVATLDQGDPGFHPYHVAPEHYHKDAAYHNGAVWPWLNGIAIQRMIELGQVDLAWRLFTNTNEISLTRGVVGGLPENLDAYPHPGESAPRLTGTYLQGWSNAEQLRVWYQGFLGIQPDLEQGVIRLAPRLPEAFGDVEFNSRIGAGVLNAAYERSDHGRRYTWRLQGQSARLDLDIVPFDRHSFIAAAGDTLMVEQTVDSLIVRHVGIGGSERERVTLESSPVRREQQARFDAILAGTEFAKPGVAAAHPAMRQSRTP